MYNVHVEQCYVRENIYTYTHTRPSMILTKTLNSLGSMRHQQLRKDLNNLEKIYLNGLEK